MSTDRPDRVFDPGLQHERSALAWERTAIATMVAGVLLARYSAEWLHPATAAVGLAQVVAGGLLLVWAGRRYEDLHGPLRAGQSPVHPTAAQVVGFSTILFTGAGSVLAVVIALVR
jgi:putative membrane protein